MLKFAHFLIAYDIWAVNRIFISQKYLKPNAVKTVKISNFRFESELNNKST